MIATKPPTIYLSWWAASFYQRSDVLQVVGFEIGKEPLLAFLLLMCHMNRVLDTKLEVDEHFGLSHGKSLIEQGIYKQILVLLHSCTSFVKIRGVVSRKTMAKTRENSYDPIHTSTGALV